MTKKITHNYVKNQEYYNILIFILISVATLITIFLLKKNPINSQNFLLQIFILMFLIMTISTILEYIQVGEYMNPLEVYELKHFLKEFINHSTTKKTFSTKYFNKYDLKSKKNFEKKFEKNKIYRLDKIKKHNEIYEIIFHKENKLNIFGKRIKINIKKTKNKYKIIRLI